jgi:tRNA(Glu) U13 pseudouridine synthase TruD
MMISNAVYEDKALALGMATGNRFSIVLREFKSTDSEEVTKVRDI